MSEREASPVEPKDGLGALPGVARLAASAAWHTTGWSVDITLRLTRRVLEVAVAPQKAGALVEDVAGLLRALPPTSCWARARQTRSQAVTSRDGSWRPSARRARGRRTSRTWTTIATARRLSGPGARSSSTARGTFTTRRTSHPAYERLVESLAPDEARILRLLLFGGPQPAVDVRTGGPLGLLNSRLLAPGLYMDPAPAPAAVTSSACPPI